MNPGMIATVLALGAVAIAALIYARRAWLVSTSLERQLMDTREQRAKQHQEDLEWARGTNSHMEAQMGRLREETSASLERSLNHLDVSLNHLAAKIDGLSERIGEDREFQSQVTRQATVLSTRIADAVEAITRKPLNDFPIDSARLEMKTEKEILALAESLTVVRPLVPYPKWRFDADLNNPDLAFLLRRRLWQYFSDRKREGPIITRWHHGTRLCVYLGNDLSRQIYVAGCIEPNEFAFLDRYLKAGMTFFDAGANDGIYTVFAAERVGREGVVYTFEPSQREMSRLRHNLALNQLSARIFPMALADFNGTAELDVAGYGHEGLNTLGAFAYDVEGGRQEMVEVARLDDVIDREPVERLDAIKIDVEGAELRLLRGAEATLRRYRPVLIFEASEASLRHQGSSVEELLEYLRAHDYALYLFDPYSGLPAPATSGAYSDNMIATPIGISLPEAVYKPWPEIAQ
jgi:FkbM family methyltransferase